MAQRIPLLLVLFVALAFVACGSGSSGADDLLGAGPTTPTEPPPEPPVEPPAEPPTEPPTEPPAGTSMTSAELAKAMAVLDSVNEERAAIGQPPLVWDDAVAESAWKHSLDMDLRDFFSHTNPDGLLPWDRLTADGVSYGGAGENIYWASWSASAAEAMDAWMNSPGHRDNILRAGWTHTGVGVHEGAGGSWWTQVFISR